MNARINKKLSKWFAKNCPLLSIGHFIDNDISLYARLEDRNSVSHVPSIEDVYLMSLWSWWMTGYFWLAPFPTYPAGHALEYEPNTAGFRPTTQNLMTLALKAEEAMRKHVDDTITEFEGDEDGH